MYTDCEAFDFAKLLVCVFKVENILIISKKIDWNTDFAFLLMCRTFAYDTIQRRHPVILTNVIDFLSRMHSRSKLVSEKVRNDPKFFIRDCVVS